LACLFAALLEAAGQNPIIAVIDSPRYSHALAGYRVPGEPVLEGRGLGDLRGAVARQELVLFEVTGAVESDRPVAGELPSERHDKLLSLLDSRAAAERLLHQLDITLRHLIDVRTLRANGPTTNGEASNG
jgi:hypothetical protein